MRAQGLSQGQVSLRCGYPQSTISKLILGKTEDPQIGTLLSIARALGVDIAELLQDVPIPQMRADPQSLEDDVRDLQAKLAALNERLVPLFELAATAVPQRRSGRRKRSK